MKWTHDLDAGALYVYLSDKTPAEQVENGDGVVVDLDSKGEPVGIEIVAPWSLVAIDDLAQLGVDPGDLELVRWVLTSPLIAAQRRHDAALRVEDPTTTNSAPPSLIPA